MFHNKKNIFPLILLPIQIGIVQLLKQYPELIEYYYSEGLYKYISKSLRTLLGWIPFSFGDVLGIVGVVFLFLGIYKLIKNKFRNVVKRVLRFVAYLSVLHFCFYFFWGLNYFRKPLSEKLNLQTSKYTTEELIQTTELILSDLHKTHLEIVHNDSLLVTIPYSTYEIYEKAILGYDKLAKKNSSFCYKKMSVKSSLVSLFQSYNGTAGYINPWTSEAQINSMIPKAGMPATTCHEIAHQIGWAAENEANFVGFLTSTLNSDIYFKYSGYRMAFRYCYRELFKRDKNQANKLWNTLHTGIKKDFKNNYVHWQKFKNPIEPYLKKGYNSYLKANNQQQGINSYNQVVDLLISYYKSLN